MSKLMLVIVMIIPMVAVYGLHLFFKSWIDPRKSFAHLILYIVLHLAAVFINVYFFSFLFYLFVR